MLVWIMNTPRLTVSAGWFPHLAAVTSRHLRKTDESQPSSTTQVVSESRLSSDDAKVVGEDEICGAMALGNMPFCTSSLYFRDISSLTANVFHCKMQAIATLECFSRVHGNEFAR